MLAEHRQNRLNRLLEKLQEIKGVTKVVQDDFNRSTIDVVLYLDDCGSRAGSLSGNKPYRFAAPLREIRRAIKLTCSEQDVYFSFLDGPVMIYTSIGKDKVKDGYSTDRIVIEVLI